MFGCLINYSYLNINSLSFLQFYKLLTFIWFVLCNWKCKHGFIKYNIKYIFQQTGSFYKHLKKSLSRVSRHSDNNSTIFLPVIISWVSSETKQRARVRFRPPLHILILLQHEPLPQPPSRIHVPVMFRVRLIRYTFVQLKIF